MRRLTLLACAAFVGCAGNTPDDETAIERILIVIPDALSACAGLVALEHPGLDVEVVTLSEISDGTPSPAQIDEFVELYEAGQGGLALILVGIHQLLPAHDVTLANLGETTWSDRPFAELADGRTVPTGRIPVADDEECAAYLNRPVETDIRERNRIVLFGNEPEILYAELYHADYAREMGFEVTLLSGPTEAELAEAFAGGDVLAAFYYGHGNYRANGSLTADNAEDILPEGILYFTGGCGFGQPPGPADVSIAEVIVTRLGGTGFGASDFGGYGYQYDFVPAALQRLTTARTVGGLQLLALETYGETEFPPERTDTFEARLVLYGDPTRTF